MPLTNGETFAGYKIVRLLGSGGMGEVYLAQHPRLPRRDALKVLRPDVSSNPSFRERFIREADLASGLRHPHIVGVHDRGEHEGQLWIAMDYIEGTDANHLLEQRYSAGMPIDLAEMVVTAVARALDYAHKKGVLHRDVKPGNIMVANLDTDDPGILLADFGIARPLDDTGGLTTTNITVGTVAYAAPEQLMGEAMDGRADEYALAATTYHLLTGAQLFPHSNPAVVISRHLNSTPPKLRHHCPDSARFDDVLQIALAKNPADRFPSCSAFAKALRDESPGSGAASAIATRPTAESPAVGSRHAWTIPASIAAIILLIAVLALAFRPWESQQSNSAGTTTPVPTTPTTTSVAPPPPPPMAVPTSAAPAPTVTVTADRPKPKGDQAAFLAQARTLPSAVLVSRYSDCSNAPTAAACATDDNVLALGAQACRAMDRYPNDSVAATRVVYPNYPSGSSYDQALLMIYAADYLCREHANMWAQF
ncbi:serine/threonine protein kinase [Mycobacterium paragordonae]|uniref:non-specific serine/threonine protein kinase n=1 Tax=Mycobacterium paragordonae TaxID=1389713 RepID=A0ABQ1C573_9MYCO|nr:serine/threonine-protein kinase [Mycobacterium paragordonae]AYE95821.1 serine/threonine protein kinase [Mycobacterium paragordonae]GFG79113.1 serine/threonine protein kinase [Mycobacterium paragordonae]